MLGGDTQCLPPEVSPSSLTPPHPNPPATHSEPKSKVLRKAELFPSPGSTRLCPALSPTPRNPAQSPRASGYR